MVFRSCCYTSCRLSCVCVPFSLGDWDRMWNSIVSVPYLYLFIYFPFKYWIFSVVKISRFLLYLTCEFIIFWKYAYYFIIILQYFTNWYILNRYILHIINTNIIVSIYRAKVPDAVLSVIWRRNALKVFTKYGNCDQTFHMALYLKFAPGNGMTHNTFWIQATWRLRRRCVKFMTTDNSWLSSYSICPVDGKQTV